MLMEQGADQPFIVNAGFGVRRAANIERVEIVTTPAIIV